MTKWNMVCTSYQLIRLPPCLEVTVGFLDPLVDHVMTRHHLERLARLLIDDVISEVGLINSSKFPI